jgi:hypothetical protein
LREKISKIIWVFSFYTPFEELGYMPSFIFLPFFWHFSAISYWKNDA